MPLIEFQFKELRQKLISYLPAYFANNNPKSKKNLSTLFYLTKNNQVSVNQVSTSHRSSISSSNSCAETTTTNNMNRSSSSLNSLPIYTMSSLKHQSSSSTTNTPSSISCFGRLVLNELRAYESKVNLLFSAPRLAAPAWLTLNSTRDETTNVDVSHQLIKDLDYLSKNLVSIQSSLKIRISTTTNGNNQRTTRPNRILDFNMKKFLFSSRLAKGESLSVGHQPQESSSPILNQHEMEKNQAQSMKNKRFLSTIISTVLKYHLSWIYTVQPAHSRENQLKQSRLRKQTPKWTRLLEKLNPYNALWAQLSDLHGAVNQPLKLVRTVVVGQNRSLVERVLFVLSYFIRCGNSSHYDVAQDGAFDFEKLLLLLSGCSSNDFDPAAANVCTATTGGCVNVTQLKFDPMAQFNSLILTTDGAARRRQRRFTSSNSSSTSSSSSSSTSSSSSFHTPFVADASSSPQILTSGRVGNKKLRLSSTLNVNNKNCNAQELPLIG